MAMAVKTTEFTIPQCYELTSVLMFTCRFFSRIHLTKLNSVRLRKGLLSVIGEFSKLYIFSKTMKAMS